MGIFARLFGLYAEAPSLPTHLVNPASGLTMVDDFVDVAGNVFGTDTREWGQQTESLFAGADVFMSDDVLSPFNSDC